MLCVILIPLESMTIEPRMASRLEKIHRRVFAKIILGLRSDYYYEQVVRNLKLKILLRNTRLCIFSSRLAIRGSTYHTLR